MTPAPRPETPSGPAFDEAGVPRRAHERLPLGLSAHGQIDGVVVHLELGNVSAGGLYLRTEMDLARGARVRAVLALPYIGGQRLCTLSGRVAWLDRDESGKIRGAGVRFDADNSPADRELLRGFLALWSPGGEG